MAFHETDRHNVWVVDDTPDYRALIALQLVRERFSVRTFGDPREILTDAYSGKALPDCIVLDVMLGGDDGYDVVRAWRIGESHGLTEYKGRIPILMYSALRDVPYNVDSATVAGADGYLTKPISAKDMALKIRELISKSA